MVEPKLVLGSNKPFAGFINVAGITKDSTVAEHNLAMNKFIEQFNAGLEVKAFEGAEGKIVIGFQ